MKDMTLKDLLRQQKDLPAMNMEPIHKAFEPDSPPSGIDESQLGRIRLHSALREKYGDDYQNEPRVKSALEHYHKESSFLNLYKRTVGARYGK